MKLQLLDPKDLSVKQIIETSTTTKQIGHIFMMCGVLYATEPDGKKDGIIRYLPFWSIFCRFKICNRYDKRKNEWNTRWFSGWFSVSKKLSSLISINFQPYRANAIQHARKSTFRLEQSSPNGLLSRLCCVGTIFWLLIIIVHITLLPTAFFNTNSIQNFT